MPDIERLNTTHPTRTGRAVAAAAALTFLFAGCSAAAEPGAQPTSETTPSVSTQSAHGLDPHGLEDAVTAVEKNRRLEIGVAVLDPVTGRTFFHRADESFALCSTFKVYAVGALLRRTAAGTSSLDSPVMVEKSDVVPNSPVTEPAAGTTMTFAQLAEAALTRSDNTAANYVLREIGGPAAVTDFARSTGDDRTRLDRWEPDLNDTPPGEVRDTSTPRALAEGYQSVLLGDALGAPEREKLTTWMLSNTTSRIATALPDGWTVADKTGGGYWGAVNDVGLVRDESGRPLIVSMLSASTTGDREAPLDGDALAEVTRAVVAAFGAGA
ncbi:class A beta-lactamase [Rhodococcus sp. HNM0569]|uniref:class A beta-lactamase n=1 Tax=Rhodococcus sp. HNM0569 TaxID=2716340 RepID=UPI00146CB11B|nr:class A beta-lactamase [Rhodococcus sp. HNM0569]NLU83400.1 class A beta-lactamase [Rhodococcus sp. HNM0569]